MFSAIIQKFVEKSPAAVTVRALMEYLLNPERLDRWFTFTRRKQRTRDILFSSLVGLMLNVVCRTHPSVRAAHGHAQLAVSLSAVYDKLKNMELTTSEAFVHDFAQDAAVLIKRLAAERPIWKPNLRIKYLDGNCLPASERRLKIMRDSAAAPLPGKALVIFEPQYDLITRVLLCPDGHAQERSQLGRVVDTIEADDVMVADRNFCVTEFLTNISQKSAYFVIRKHGNLTVKPLEKFKFLAEADGQTVFEQLIELRPEHGPPLRLRRIKVELCTPTRDGDRVLEILTNVPDSIADAIEIAELYRTRWKIETAFQKLEKNLNSELNTLGYPQAALFGFSMALVAFNLYAVVMAALRAAHPDQKIDETVSDYAVAGEIARTTTGLEIAVPEADWQCFAVASIEEMCSYLLLIAQQFDLTRYTKTKRGPKKPPTPRTKFKGQPHVSTAKLLAVA